MLTEFLIRDETICSLGKTEHTFTVHHTGKQPVCRNRFSSRDFSYISQLVPRVGG
jgi:hypothetical protein